MKIDAEKISQLIQRFSDETVGACTMTGTCIGMIDGKQIQLRVVSDEDELMSHSKKFECVKPERPTP